MKRLDLSHWPTGQVATSAAPRFALSTVRAWVQAGVMALSCAIVAACGGGGSDPQTAGNGVGVGGTGAAASGRVSGFGSIIVNGIRFDDSRSSVADDDGVTGTVKLGMVVDVKSSALTTDAASGLQQGTASQIVYSSSIKGKVEATPGGNVLTVLGQTVTVDAATVYEGYASGYTSVQVNDEVEVYAFSGATGGSYVATRIERKSGLTEYKLRGKVSSLDTTAKTFSIGTANISYASMGTSVPALSDGQIVRVKLGTTPSSGTWQATRIDGVSVSLVDGGMAEVEGIVSDFLGVSSFKVNGVPVNAGATTASLSNGLRVEVEGVSRAGVLVANKVEIKNSSGSDVETRLFGPIESVNTGAQTFVVRGVTVRYDNSSNDPFDKMTSSDLQVDFAVEVRGTMDSNGSQVLATRIKPQS
jgi:Domain of unknown function (DUF5666)